MATYEGPRTAVICRRFRIVLSLVLFLALDQASGRALTLAPDDIVASPAIRIDPVTGEQELFSSQGFRFVALDPDMRIVQYSQSYGSGDINPMGNLFRLDPATGERNLVYQSYDLAYSWPVAIVVDGGGTIYVARGYGIKRIEPDTGGAFWVPLESAAGEITSFTIGPDGDLYLTRRWSSPGYSPIGYVTRVDPITGDGTLLATGGSLWGPKDLVFERNGTLAVVDTVYKPEGAGSYGALIEVDPATGSQQMLLSGDVLPSPSDIDLDGMGRMFVLQLRSEFDRNGHSVPFNTIVRINQLSGLPEVVATKGLLNQSGAMAVVPPYDRERPVARRPEDLCLVPHFAPPENTPVELSPIDIAAVDLNRDGVLDVVVTNLFSNTVSVLSGNGNGTFAPKESYPTGGANSDGLAVGDLNGDLAPDLVVANLNSSTIGVLLNQGDGKFSSVVLYPVGTNPTSIAIGDIDKDGAVDLAVANYFYGEVTLLFGRGDGTFVSRGANLSLSGGRVGAVELGDLDRDGKLDLVVGNGYLGISVLPGHGDGTFGAPTSSKAGYGSNDMVLVDLDGDGNLDVAEVDGYAEGFYLLRGRGDGTLEPGVLTLTGETVLGIAAGDFNGDGRADLAVANRRTDEYGFPNNGDVTVLSNYKEGKFGPGHDFGMGVAPVAVAVGDVDGDGGTDLLSANIESWNVSVRRGQSAVSVKPRRLAFPPQLMGQAAAAKRVTVTSCGPAPLTVSSTSIVGSEGGSFAKIQDDCAGKKLAPASTCSIDVAFAPVTDGWARAKLELSSDAATGTAGTDLLGTSSNADLETKLTTTDMYFITGSKVVFTLSLRNSGPTEAQSVKASFIPPGWSKIASMKASQGSCTIPKAKVKVRPAVCSIGNLGTGEHAKILFTVNLKAPLNVPVPGVVTTTSETFDPVESNNAVLTPVVAYKPYYK